MVLINVSSSYAHMHQLIMKSDNYMNTFFDLASPLDPQNNDTFTYSIQNDSSLQLIDNGIYTDIITRQGPANLSVSVCYSAFDTAKIHVDMHSDSNRTEPEARWKPGNGFYTVPDINQQLGNNRVTDHASRGILKLAPRMSWIPDPADVSPSTVAPFVQVFANMGLIVVSCIWYSGWRECYMVYRPVCCRHR